MQSCIACGAPRAASTLYCLECGSPFDAPREAASVTRWRVTRVLGDLAACRERGIERLDIAAHDQPPVAAEELGKLASAYAAASRQPGQDRAGQIRQLLWDALTAMERENAASAHVVRGIFFGDTRQVAPGSAAGPGFVDLDPASLLERLKASSRIDDEREFTEMWRNALRDFAAFLVTFCEPLRRRPAEQPETKIPPRTLGAGPPASPPPHAPPPSPGAAAHPPAHTRHGRSAPPRQRRRAGHTAESLSRAVREAIRPGLLTFNPPEEMTQGRKERVEVGIARSAELRESLAAGLRGRGEPQFEDVDTSSIMGVELKGISFEITPLSPAEQLVAPLARWEFDVTPRQSGLQTLTLCITLRIESPVTPKGSIAVPVLERQIRIRVDLGYGTRRFFAANWQWLIATALGLGGALAAWIAFFH